MGYKVLRTYSLEQQTVELLDQFSKMGHSMSGVIDRAVQALRPSCPFCDDTEDAFLQDGVWHCRNCGEQIMPMVVEDTP